MMDMARHTRRRLTVADAVRKNHAGEIVAARKHRGKIAAFVPAGRYGDDITFQSGQLQGAVRFLIPGPQLHAAEGAHRRFGAIKLFGFNLLELHTCLMPEKLAWVQYLPWPHGRASSYACQDLVALQRTDCPLEVQVLEVLRDRP